VNIKSFTRAVEVAPTLLQQLQGQQLQASVACSRSDTATISQHVGGGGQQQLITLANLPNLIPIQSASGQDVNDIKPSTAGQDVDIKPSASSQSIDIKPTAPTVFSVQGLPGQYIQQGNQLVPVSTSNNTGNVSYNVVPVQTIQVENNEQVNDPLYGIVSNYSKRVGRADNDNGSTEAFIKRLNISM
jgi:hypothetical protein